MTISPEGTLDTVEQAKWLPDGNVASGGARATLEMTGALLQKMEINNWSYVCQKKNSKGPMYRIIGYTSSDNSQQSSAAPEIAIDKMIAASP